MGIVDAYLTWQEEIGEEGLDASHPQVAKESLQATYKVHVIDVFCTCFLRLSPLYLLTVGAATYTMDAELAEGDQGVPAALVRQGLMPCAPFSPSLAFMTRLLELYRNNHLCCPHLAIQPFIKSICDLHGVPFCPYLSQQFSIAYDLYLSIHEDVQRRVDVALQCDSPNWRLRNTCPACSYKLKGEDQLIFKMLITMDGNDSLKRIIRRAPVEDPAEWKAGPECPQVGDSREWLDSRRVGRDYFISRERVDRWAKDALEELLPGPEYVCLSSPGVNAHLTGW